MEYKFIDPDLSCVSAIGRSWFYHQIAKWGLYMAEGVFGLATVAVAKITLMYFYFLYHFLVPLIPSLNFNILNY
jgi:hypothetical protein